MSGNCEGLDPAIKVQVKYEHFLLLLSIYCEGPLFRDTSRRLIRWQSPTLTTIFGESSSFLAVI